MTRVILVSETDYSKITMINWLGNQPEIQKIEVEIDETPRVIYNSIGLHLPLRRTGNLGNDTVVLVATTRADLGEEARNIERWFEQPEPITGSSQAGLQAQIGGARLQGTLTGAASAFPRRKGSW